MGVVLGHIWVVEVGVMNHDHHGQRGDLRIKRSGESGWVSDQMSDGGVRSLG